MPTGKISIIIFFIEWPLKNKSLVNFAERLDNEKKRIEQEKIQVSETLDKMKVKLRGLKDELEDEKVRHKQLELRSENELNERKAK